MQIGGSFEENRCISLIRQKECIAVRGNHEDLALSAIANNESLRGKFWSENLEYIEKLPKHMTLNGRYFLIHKMLPKGYPTKHISERRLNMLEGKEICFFGHTHKPVILKMDRQDGVEEVMLKDNKAELDEGFTYLINPGGLGLYDGEMRSYMLFEPEKRLISLRVME